MRDERRIMVPLDGSVKDLRALAVASALADLSEASLHLVHVAGGDAERDIEGNPASRTVAEEYLATRAGHLAAETRRDLTWKALQSADIVETLIRHATECDALVVVMGTRAPNAVGRAMVGSIADRVMRECPRPVVLVPPGAEYMAGKHMHFGRVLVPLDGSALSAQALEFLLRFSRSKELEYVLLEAVPMEAERQTDGVLIDGTGSQRAREASTRLEAVAASFRARGLATVEIEVAEAEDAAQAIVGAVRDCLVEMIVMSTRGAGGLRRLVLGSVAEGVVRASDVPVLLLTPATLASH